MTETTEQGRVMGPATRTATVARPWQGSIVAAVLVCVLLALPFAGLARLDLNLGAEIWLDGCAALGVGLLVAYGGMFSLGSAMFLGLAAYGVALLTTHAGWPFLAAAVVSFVGTLAVAVVVGLLLVRLSAHYFAVATLGLATALEALIEAFPLFTGGSSGLATTRTLDLGVLSVSSNFGWYVVAGVVGLCGIAFYRWFVHGKRGRLLKLTRADELAARVLGVPTYRVRLTAFTAAAVFPAVAGIVLLPFIGLVTPDNAGAVQSVQLLALAIIGGAAYSYGGILGALLVVWVQAALNTVGNYSLLVYGVVFLAFALYANGGIAGLIARGLELAGLRDAARRRGSEMGEHLGHGGEPSVLRRDGRTQAETGRRPDVVPDMMQRGHSVATQREVERVVDAEGRALPIERLRVDHVSVNFGGTVAVDDVSVVVHAGEVAALIGSNGAGKSTLLNIVSGVEPCRTGTVALNGMDVTSADPAVRTHRGLARTFQVPRLVDDLSVVDNIVAGGEAADGGAWWWEPRRRASELAREAEGLLASVGMGELAGRRADSLGTGQRKFVELLRAVGEQPAVCLLDEPAVGLSLDEIDHLAHWIRAMKEDGAAVLVIDHNLDFVRDLADVIYVMDLGRIVYHGDASETWSRFGHDVSRLWAEVHGAQAPAIETSLETKQ